MWGYVLSGVKWVFTTHEGQALLWTVIGLLGWRKSIDKKTLERVIESARGIFYLVEDFARNKTLTSVEKERIALGQLRYMLEAYKIPEREAYLEAARVTWRHLGWAEKVERR